MKWLNPKILGNALQFKLKKRGFSFVLESPDHANGDSDRRIKVTYKLTYCDVTPILKITIDDRKPVRIEINDETQPQIEAMFDAASQHHVLVRNGRREYRNHCSRLDAALIDEIT
jgi:hypothetical protein